jgi:uncharacterized membrane-anchored protein
MNHDTESIYVPKRKWFWLAVIVQLCLYALLVGLFYNVIWFGKSVWIKTVPVDPSDPYYGHYYNLALEIETIPVSKWKSTSQLKNYDENQRIVQVLLQQKSNSLVYEPIAVYLPNDELPTVSANQAYLKAKVEYVESTAIKDDVVINGKLHLNYDLDRYYISQQQAFKTPVASGKSWVELRVSPWGKLMHDISFEEPK